MEYVFGTDAKRQKRTLLTKGSEHTDLSGFCEVVREFDDCTITDDFYVTKRINRIEDVGGNCYDRYEIDMHYRVIDKIKKLDELYEALDMILTGVTE